MATFWVGEDGGNREDNAERKLGGGHADGNGHSIDMVKSDATTCGILSDLDGTQGEDGKGNCTL
jgi:hypothetical protein